MISVATALFRAQVSEAAKSDALLGASDKLADLSEGHIEATKLNSQSIACLTESVAELSESVKFLIITSKILVSRQTCLMHLFNRNMAEVTGEVSNHSLALTQQAGELNNIGTDISLLSETVSAILNKLGYTD